MGSEIGRITFYSILYVKAVYSLLDPVIGMDCRGNRTDLQEE